MSGQFLYDSQIRAGVEQIGHEASPEVMAREALHAGCPRSFRYYVGYPLARKALEDEMA